MPDVLPAIPLLFVLLRLLPLQSNKAPWTRDLFAIGVPLDWQRSATKFHIASYSHIDYIVNMNSDELASRVKKRRPLRLLGKGNSPLSSWFCVDAPGGRQRTYAACSG